MGDSDRVVEYEEIKQYENNKDVLIIDVREHDEIASTGKIGGSINIPLGELENALKRLNQEEFLHKYNVQKPNQDFPVVFSCKMGGRAQKAMKMAQDNGFLKAKFYQGSWNEWEKKLKQNRK